MVEEIKFDPRQLEMLQLDNEGYREIINQSKEGALVGVSWNRKVYEYLFESGLSLEELNSLMFLSSFDYSLFEDEGEEGIKC